MCLLANNIGFGPKHAVPQTSCACLFVRVPMCIEDEQTKKMTKSYFSLKYKFLKKSRVPINNFYKMISH